MPSKDGAMDDKKKTTKDVVNKKQKQMMNQEEYLPEEEYDHYKDRMAMSGREIRSKDTKDASSYYQRSDKKTKGKTVLQKEAEKKYGKGKSALDMVKADIEKKHGKGAIMNVKKKKKKKVDEEYVIEDAKMGRMSDDDLNAAHEKFSKMDQSMPSNKFMLARIKKEQKKRKKVTESTKAKKFLDDKAKKLQKEYDSQSKEKKNNPAFQSNRLNPKPQYNSYEPEGELVDEMKVKQVVPKKAVTQNPKDMSKKAGEKAPVDYRMLAQSYEPVGNIFKEFKMTSKKGKSMDPVGQEDGDINNDGKKDGTDKYLANRRKAIGKAIAKKRGRVKEGFSAWRIDLDFNEQVKK